jgi:4-aminobutyrate aminotransferase-like enzyme
MRAPIQELIYYSVGEHEMTRGEGIHLFDRAGREYIDAGAGTFNLSLGYNHPEVVAAIREQAGRLVHLTSTFQAGPVSELVRRLVALSPPNLTQVHLKVSGGATANEGAVKMAQAATGGRDVITLFRSHHGQTMMTTAMSGEAFRRAPFPASHPEMLHVPDPYCLRCFYRQDPSSCGLLCAERINDFIEHAGSGSVACVVVEPVAGSGGNIVTPAGYLAALRRLCDERGIMLIFDEVQTGIGRVGRMFAADHFGVRPDAITLGKGLGGSGAQVAAILTAETMAGLPGEYHSFTHGANVLAAAAAVATLDVIAAPGFLARVREVGAQVRGRLEELVPRFPAIGDVRGLGLMIGVELVDERGRPDVDLTRRLVAQAMDHGLILRSSRYGRGNVVKIRPPLIIDREEADLLCDRFERLLRAVTG